MIVLEGLFWMSLLLVVYAYAMYPVVLWVCSRTCGEAMRPAPTSDTDLPAVTVLVAAHNEERVIASRIENALATDYPTDRFQILVASDGSTDRTVDIVRQFAARGVALLESPVRRGKATILNAAFRTLESDIVVLSDANTFTDAAAIRRLVRWFERPEVGIACGKLILSDPATGDNVDGLYWRYESFLRSAEARLGALLGANGAIYAVRRSLFSGIRRDTLLDDFTIPLKTRMRTGCAVVYDETAIAREQSAPSMADEFRRRARIGAGGMQAIVAFRSLLAPHNGWIGFTFLSHKIFRWLCPLALLTLLATSIALEAQMPFRAFVALQGAAYGAAVLGRWLPGQSVACRALRLPTMFAMMNGALLFGCWRWLSSEPQGTWERTIR